MDITNKKDANCSKMMRSILNIMTSNGECPFMRIPKYLSHATRNFSSRAELDYYTQEKKNFRVTFDNSNYQKIANYSDDKQAELKHMLEL